MIQSREEGAEEEEVVGLWGERAGDMLRPRTHAGERMWSVRKIRAGDQRRRERGRRRRGGRRRGRGGGGGGGKGEGAGFPGGGGV